MSLKKYLLPILFGGVLLVHALDSWLGFMPEPELNERRAMTEKPELDWSFLDPFPRDYEAYYNDHFNWRNYFVNANAYLNYHAFGQSALPDKVVVGKDGWLFKSGFQLDMYRGKFQFNQEQLESLRKELQRRKEAVEAIGGKYYLSIPPLKHHLYAEYLPDNIRRINPESSAQQLAEYLQQHSDIDYIDLFGPLKALKDRDGRRLYLKTDHHWNDYAALFACKVLMDQLREDFPALEPVALDQFMVDSVTYDGMLLAEMLGLEKDMPETLPVIRSKVPYSAKDSPRSYPVPHDFPYPEEYCIAKTTTHTNVPKLMMVRESFANPMVKIMAEHFSESVFLFDNWKHQFHGDILEKEQPDIYIQFVWEGLIFNLLENPPAEAGWE